MLDSTYVESDRETCHLLVVDDEPDILMAIQRQLRKKYDVYIATNAEQAWALLRERQIDVIVSDQRMPGTNGAELLARVRQEFPDIVRLMLTGYADISAVIAAINEGQVEHYIQKPWEAGELEQIIDESYENRVLRRANAALNVRLETALEAEKRLNQLQSQFISLVSHEFRTPLTVISVTAENMRVYHGQFADGVLEKKLDLVTDQVQRLTHLMEEVTTLGTYEQRNHPFNPVEFDICAETMACINQLRVSTAGTHTIVTEVPEHCPSFVGDPNLLAQIITELISNAVKFSPPTSTISCRLVVDSAQAEISITDEGGGIVEKDLEKMFMPFEKGENHSFVHGLGLGLAVVRHAVNLHEGHISVESNDIGGTTIHVSLHSLAEKVS